MERRDFFALLFGTIAAPFLKKPAEAGWDDPAKAPSGFISQWYGGSNVPEGWEVLPDNYHMHSVVDPGHSHAPLAWVRKR
jgi:hypothetical protein